LRLAKKLKLAVDENIAFAEENFSAFGELLLLNGREITKEKIRDCDILITRSVTKVNRELLEGTNVRFVGTATIGYDHIDLNYLNSRGIAFANAPGCNAYSVAEYVFSALLFLAEKRNFELKSKSIGIVGAGNIGSKAAMFARALGMKTVVNDPPLEDAGGKGFSPLEEALACDIITFHTPLNLTGKYKSYHLLNSENANSLRDGAILINSSRGAVTENETLLQKTKAGEIVAVLDVWENEPEPSLELVARAEIATPHIAGYSVDGKVNGSKMIFDALNEFLGTNYAWRAKFDVPQNEIDCTELTNTEEILKKIFAQVYPIERDSALFKREMSASENPARTFDLLRKNYPARYELSNYVAVLNKNADAAALRKFRINVKIPD